MKTSRSMQAVLHAGAEVKLSELVKRRELKCRLSSKDEDTEGCTVIVQTAEQAATMEELLTEVCGSFRVTWDELVMNDLATARKIDELL